MAMKAVVYDYVFDWCNSNATNYANLPTIEAIDNMVPKV